MVINDFMSIKNQCRIGFRDAVMHDPKNAVPVTHKILFAGSNEFRIMNGRDAVSSHAAPKNLIGRDQCFRVVKAIPVVCSKRCGIGKHGATDEHYMTKRYKEFLKGHRYHSSYWSL